MLLMRFLMRSWSSTLSPSSGSWWTGWSRPGTATPSVWSLWLLTLLATNTLVSYWLFYNWQYFFNWQFFSIKMIKRFCLNTFCSACSSRKLSNHNRINDKGNEDLGFPQQVLARHNNCLWDAEVEMIFSNFWSLYFTIPIWVSCKSSQRGIKRVWAAALSTGHCELPLSWTDPENISLENSVRAAHPPHLDQTPGRPQLVVKVDQAVQRLLGEVELGQELPQLGVLRDQAEESLGQQGPGRQVVVSFTFTIS